MKNHAESLRKKAKKRKTVNWEKVESMWQMKNEITEIKRKAKIEQILNMNVNGR